MSYFYCLGFLIATFTYITASPTERIVGGFNATAAQFPYQVSLLLDHRHFCGGSIISPNYVLTAAHCVVASGTTPYPAENFTISAGTNNRTDGGVIVQVKRVIVHQDYFSVENDLALLELAEHLTFSAKIQPIDLPTEEVPVGSDVIISGWGLTVNRGANFSDTLQWHTVQAINKLQCYMKIRMYSDELLCLDHPSGAGICVGDSGGPAAYDGKLVGVAGVAVLVCGTNRPDVYAKVFYNLEWIKENMI